MSAELSERECKHLCNKCKLRQPYYKVTKSKLLLDFLGIADTKRRVFRLCHKCSILFSAVVAMEQKP